MHSFITICNELCDWFNLFYVTQMIYGEKKVEFLLDEEDTNRAYEKRGKEGHMNLYEEGMAALGGIGRTQQVEALTRKALLSKTQLVLLLTER